MMLRAFSMSFACVDLSPPMSRKTIRCPKRHPGESRGPESLKNLESGFRRNDDKDLISELNLLS
jgi:hypothetical protein